MLLRPCWIDKHVWPGSLRSARADIGLNAKYRDFHFNFLSQAGENWQSPLITAPEFFFSQAPFRICNSSAPSEKRANEKGAEEIRIILFLAFWVFLLYNSVACMLYIKYNTAWYYGDFIFIAKILSPEAPRNINVSAEQKLPVFPNRLGCSHSYVQRTEKKEKKKTLQGACTASYNSDRKRLHYCRRNELISFT